MTDWTTQRLLALKPGETMTFYRGDLTQDLFRAMADAPTCVALLRGLRRTVDELEAAGRIKVSQRVVSIEQRQGWAVALKRFHPLTVTEYVAVGC